MAITPEVELTGNEPIFLETLAAAAGGISTDEAATLYREISDITDLHRVEAFLEDHTV